MKLALFLLVGLPLALLGIALLLGVIVAWTVVSLVLIILGLLGAALCVPAAAIFGKSLKDI